MKDFWSKICELNITLNQCMERRKRTGTILGSLLCTKLTQYEKTRLLSWYSMYVGIRSSEMGACSLLGSMSISVENIALYSRPCLSSVTP